MPYSVPPPPLPPVVNVLLPEVSNHSVPSIVSAPVSHPAPEFAQAQANQTGTVISSEHCTIQAETADCETPTAGHETVEGAALNAEPLGKPIEVSLPTSTEAMPWVQEAEASQSALPTFLPLPDLDVLVQIERQASLPPPVDRQFNPSSPRPPAIRARSSSVLPQSGDLAQVPSYSTSETSEAASETLLPQQIEHFSNLVTAEAPLTVPEPGSRQRPLELPLMPPGTNRVSNPAVEQAEAVPLTAPTSDSGSAPPPDPEPVLPPSSPEETEPDGQPAAPAAEPSLEPSGGQTLTIPTPGSQPANPEQPETGQPETAPANPPGQGSVTPPQSPRRSPRRPRGAVPIDQAEAGEVIEVTANRQEYDTLQQIFRAEGNARVRFRQGVLNADLVRVNIPNRLAVAEGNAVLTRGQQVIQGERFDYNFGLDEGTISRASGQLFLSSTSSDFNPTLPTDIGAATVPNQSLADQITASQPLQVAGSTGGFNFGLSSQGSAPPGQQGQVNRVRFEADQATFTGGNLVATNVRITNDPFSPPELELRSNRVTYTRLSPTQAEIRASNPRLVFDQGFSLPLLINRLVLDNRKRNPGLFQFGYDERDRDGFYIERPLDVFTSPIANFTLTPQILVQRAITDGFGASSFGLIAGLDVSPTPTTSLTANASFASLDFGEIEDNLRASVRARQQVFNHTVALEYSYRDRLFNGSLGYQDVHSNLGLVITSPTYTLGKSGIIASYQGSVQFVNAQTDQQELFPLDKNDRNLACIPRDDRDDTGNGCADLTRYQAAVALDRSFLLWAGTPLPPTRNEGLRYTPNPLVPYIALGLGLRGVYSGYSNGDTQANLTGTVALSGQFGHFSRPYLDYTAFALIYSGTALSGESPFLFDRVADQQVVTAAITQQIYGPVRFGVQTSYNLSTGDNIDTVYTLEYSRRTYSVSFSYSVKREAAALSLRISDFNWTGDPGPFSGLGSRRVVGGVER